MSLLDNPLFWMTWGTPNVTKLLEKRNVKKLIYSMHYTSQSNEHAQEDAKINQDAEVALVKLGSLAVDDLCKALNHLEFCSKAAKVLGKIGDIRAVEPLISLLRKGWDLAMPATAEALGEIGDMRAVEPLISSMRTSGGFSQYKTTACFAKALGKLGDPRSISPLRAKLENEDDYETGIAIVDALASIDDPGALDALEDIIYQKLGSKALRKVTKDAIARILPGADEAEILVADLDRNDPQNRETAAVALVKIGKGAVWPLIKNFSKHSRYRDSLDKTVGEVLRQIGNPASARIIQVIDDGEIPVEGSGTDNIYSACIEALGYIGDEPSLKMILRAFKDKFFCYAAANAMGFVADVRVVKPLVTTLRTTHDARMQGLIKRALVQVKDPQAIDQLLEALKDNNTYVREAASVALGNFNHPCVAEPLIEALKDPSEHVRVAAVRFLGKLKDSRFVEPLVAVLDDEDNRVVLAAAIVLIRSRDKRAFQPLITSLNALYHSGLQSIYMEELKEGVTALAEFIDPNARYPDAINLLRKMSSHMDSALSGLAVSALRRFGVEPAES